MTTRFALKLMTAAAVLGAAISMSATASAQEHNPAYSVQHAQPAQYYGGQHGYGRPHMAPPYVARPPAYYGHPPRHYGWRHHQRRHENAPYYSNNW